MGDIYDDARLYDALGAQQFGGSDLAYWQHQCAHHGGAVLELACGSGRLTIPLAEEGVDIEGLDLSPAMLALAREKSRSLSLPWHLGDATEFTVDRKFSLIFLPNNSVAHLLRWIDLVSCLNRVKRHLRTGWAVRARLLQPVTGPADARDPAGAFPGCGLRPPGYGRGGGRDREQAPMTTATQINHIRWFWRFEGRAEEVVHPTYRCGYTSPRNSMTCCPAPGLSSRKSMAVTTCRRSPHRLRSS